MKLAALLFTAFLVGCSAAKTGAEHNEHELAAPKMSDMYWEKKP